MRKIVRRATLIVIAIAWVNMAIAIGSFSWARYQILNEGGGMPSKAGMIRGMYFAFAAFLLLLSVERWLLVVDKKATIAE